MDRFDGVVLSIDVMVSNGRHEVSWEVQYYSGSKDITISSSGVLCSATMYEIYGIYENEEDVYRVLSKISSVKRDLNMLANLVYNRIRLTDTEKEALCGTYIVFSMIFVNSRVVESIDVFDENGDDIDLEKIGMGHVINRIRDAVLVYDGDISKIIKQLSE